MNRLLLAATAAIAMIAAPVAAATVFDPSGDFVPGSPTSADLDVTSFSINYDAATMIFMLGATFAGNFDVTTPGRYVIGVNTGTGVNAPFGGAPFFQPNVRFNQAIVVRKDGIGNVGTTALDPTTISLSGDVLSVAVPLSLLPSTGFAPENYLFNIWPRSGFANPDLITDFAPDNQTISASGQFGVPEPTSWALMLAGFGAIGAMLRIGRRRRMIVA